MTIHPKTLPDGVVAEVDHGNCIEPRYLYDGGTRVHPDASTVPLGGRSVARVFVPVPDGVAYDDALRAVNDARPWVPLPDGPKAEHKGARLRRDYMGSVDHLTHGGKQEGHWFSSDGTLHWFVHPDDVPDPDADLIERIADKMAALGYEPVAGQTYAAFMRDYARAALAAIREDQP